jgi:peptide/nickel transport system ATP-binding protein
MSEDRKNGTTPLQSVPLLSVRNLVVRFASDDGDVTAVDDVSFDVPRSSTVALVGESGCGKSVTAHSIMRLLPIPPAKIAAGEITLAGESLLALSERHMRSVRGERISIVFQDPMSSLNPVYSIGAQLSEAIRVHRSTGRSAARKRSIELLERVGLPDAAQRLAHYPQQLSGGMRQRVLIAMALACDPELLIADEPTTALDMLAAAQINTLLADLRREREMSMLLISHDIGAVAQSADYVVVMYAGQVVEKGPAAAVLRAPNHPYTRGLIRSMPPLLQRRRRRRPTPTRLPTIGGTVPVLRGEAAQQSGCRFADRCSEVYERCREEQPTLLDAGPLGEAGEQIEARCFLVEQGVVLPLTRALSSRPPAPAEDAAPDSSDYIEDELEFALERDSMRVPKRLKLAAGDDDDDRHSEDDLGEDGPDSRDLTEEEGDA